MIDSFKIMIKADKIAIISFGCIEMIIGLVTLLSLAEAKLFFGIAKPPGVFLFIALTSLVSFILGVGILRYKMWARKLLMFFAGYIILTKILIFLGILRVSPPFETLIPSFLKNLISVAYHFSVIIFFNREKTRPYFKQ